jgi:chromosomal replication initiator protein
LNTQCLAPTPPVVPAHDLDIEGERIAVCLAKRMGAARVERYFGQQPAVRVGPAGLEIPVSSSFIARLLDRQFKDMVLQAATEATGQHHAQVRFVVAEDLPMPAGCLHAHSHDAGSEQAGTVNPLAPAVSPSLRSASLRRRDPAARAARSGAPLDHYNLAEFIVGPSNRLAYESASRLTDDDRMPSPALVYVHSACGMGKTHLLHGVALRFAQRRAGATIRITTGENLVTEYISSVRNSRVDQFRRNHRNVDIFCLDDISALAGKPATQQELIYTLDAIAARRGGAGRVCVSGPANPRSVRGLSEGLISRLLAGIVVPITVPDQPLRENIVRVMARRRGLDLDDLAAQTLARSVPAQSSIREMEGLVVKVEAIHRLLDGLGDTGRQAGTGASGSIGLLTVQRALDTRLAHQSTGGVRPPVRFTAILGAVCHALCVPETEVLASGRHALIVIARALCAYVARKATTMSFPEIARALQRPNHSTIITAYQRVCRQIDAQQRFCLGAGRGEMSIADMARQLLVAVQAA